MRNCTRAVGCKGIDTTSCAIFYEYHAFDMALYVDLVSLMRYMHAAWCISEASRALMWTRMHMDMS